MGRLGPSRATYMRMSSVASKRLVPSEYGQTEKGTVEGTTGVSSTRTGGCGSAGSGPTFSVGPPSWGRRRPSRAGATAGCSDHDRVEDWDKPAGIEAGRRFPAAMDKNVFYDPDHPQRGLEAPNFSHLMAAPRAKYPSFKEFVPPPSSDFERVPS
jgi:hypothetical protein